MTRTKKMVREKLYWRNFAVPTEKHWQIVLEIAIDSERLNTRLSVNRACVVQAKPLKLSQ